MRGYQHPDRAALHLPESRRALRRVVVGGLLPLVLLGASATRGCCGCFGDTGSSSRAQPGHRADDPFQPGFLGGSATISFPNPDGTELIGNKARGLLTTVTAGMSVLYPAGTLRISGTAATVAARGTRVPKKINLDMEHTPTGESARKVFSTVLKIKKGTIKQTNEEFNGFTAMTDEPVKMFLRPKGGPLATDQTYTLDFSYRATPAAVIGALRTYGWLGLRALEAGRRLMRTVPDDAAVLPLLFRADSEIEAKAKQDVVRMKFGVAFDTPAVDLRIGGGFFGVGANRASAPTSMKLFIVVRDAEGNRKLSVNYKLVVKDNAIVSVTKSIQALSIEPNDVLDVKVKLKGGTVNPGDGVFIFLTATPSG